MAERDRAPGGRSTKLEEAPLEEAPKREETLDGPQDLIDQKYVLGREEYMFFYMYSFALLTTSR
jgi:hypothetical protein